MRVLLWERAAFNSQSSPLKQERDRVYPPYMGPSASADRFSTKSLIQTVDYISLKMLTDPNSCCFSSSRISLSTSYNDPHVKAPSQASGTLKKVGISQIEVYGG